MQGKHSHPCSEERGSFRKQHFLQDSWNINLLFIIDIKVYSLIFYYYNTKYSLLYKEYTIISHRNLKKTRQWQNIFSYKKLYWYTQACLYYVNMISTY